MHIPALNVTELIFGLLRGSLDCDRNDDKSTWDWAVLQGDVWKEHGAAVAACTPYLPGSFDRPPRNPAEKMNSGYKAWEYLIYLYGLAPALLFGILPEEYWINLCKLISGSRLLLQHRITPAQLLIAHHLIIDSCQQKSIHSLSHAAPETWTIERTIGNLGEELRLHSNPYQNITQRAIIRAQMNALQAIIPELADKKGVFPRGSKDLGDGYVLLTATDNCARDTRECESEAMRVYYENRNGVSISVQRWLLQKVLRVSPTAAWQFAEVLCYHIIDNEDGTEDVVAMVSLYSAPNPHLLDISFNALISCKPLGDEGILVVNVKSIHSVVAAIPHPPTPGHPELEGCVFIVEKPGLDIATLAEESRGTTEEETRGE
ncbi:hypothetical protein BDQ17DRAFT_1394658 [Cyathus striatus]|nr:hypothetical protein BDQ17DRAFT_1394658 [Cyathus striatus]